MNIKIKYSYLGKTLLSCTVFAGILTSAVAAPSDTPLQEVAQAPLNLSEGVAPNMIFTLDESGSMSWAYVPDAGTTTYDNLIGAKSITNSRRFRAANTNPMYYNPNILYEIPPAFDKKGVEYSLNTSFTDAPVNGFDPNKNQGNKDLSIDYRVVKEHRIPDPKGTFNYANHPDSDLTCSIAGFSSDGTRTCTDKVEFEITRTTPSKNNFKCTAIVITGEVNKEASCSISGNKATASFKVTDSVPAYYYEFDGTLDNRKCEKNKDDKYAGGEDCYRLRWVNEDSAYDQAGNRLRDAAGALVDGRQNFAIWYSFYKTRALATLSATSLAFDGLSPDIRLTWQDLATCTSFYDGKSCGENSLKPYTPQHKGEFYQWLHSVYFNKSTPLPAAMKRAGDFLAEKGSPAWQRYPGEGNRNTTENTYGCRPSYHVLMTDGMWNATVTAPKSFRSDEVTFTTPGGVNKPGVSYSKVAPFYDSTTNTLADIAMHYWATDLNTGLANQVPTYIPYKNLNSATKEYWDPRNNPAEWQHMINFVMGLGLTNSLDVASVPWAGSTFAGEGYAKLKAGTVDWPKASSGSSNNVYDLWHAAVNSRGDFYSVDSPEAMVQAFKSILTRIADRKDSATKPGINNALESDGEEEISEDRLVTYFYQTAYDSSDWTGNIKKIKKYRQYNAETKDFDEVVEQGWNAKDKVPNADSRKIWIAGSGANKLQAFTVAAAGSPSTANSLAHYLNVNPDPAKQVATWQQRLQYIRGSKNDAGDAEDKLRIRSTLLGDFLSSQPVVVSGARYLEGFANQLEGNTAYTTYKAKLKGRRSQLYIGGNDGMLHGFDTQDGSEKFAFIPTAVFPKLNKLTGKNYLHEYYVDGTPVIADVYDGSNWRTILVGTLRAGGKGLFALDITDPDQIKLLWELDESSAAVASLRVKPGYSFPKPTIARLHNGKWAVVTGNGYKSEGASTGAAALYVIDAMTGTMISSLEVQSDLKQPNGLSTPRLADYNSDGVVDYAYAGDLHGNLWRFDLLGDGATPATLTPPTNGQYGSDTKTGGISKFAVSYGGEPMFTATSTLGNQRQAITSAPSLTRHPTGQGYLVAFGTGKYFEVGDKKGEEDFAQTLYGIWDMNTKAQITVKGSRIQRKDLKRQSITSQTTGTGLLSKTEREARIVSSDPVEWYVGFDPAKAVKQQGWYVDLQVNNKIDGEMAIESMQTLGSMLMLSTLVPNSDPCASGSSSWTYAINTATGGRTTHHAFDTRTPANAIVSGIKFGSEGGVSINQNEQGLSAQGLNDSEAIYLPKTAVGRQSWRVVPEL